MKHYAGIDVSLGSASVSVVDADGKIFREAKVASEPAALISWLLSLGVRLERIGLEAGPLSNGSGTPRNQGSGAEPGNAVSMFSVIPPELAKK